MMIESFSDFIYIADGALEPEFCKNAIEKFERDDNKHQGCIGEGIVDTSVKDSVDLNISKCPGWEEEDQVFYNSLSTHHELFMKGKWSSTYVPGLLDCQDSGYQIQRTLPGSGYTWHHDSLFVKSNGDIGVRFSTYIWYLNDIHEDGYTEFIDGTKIQPRAGKIVIFPATWTYMHRGYPPKNQTKYLVTGWMYSK